MSIAEVLEKVLLLILFSVTRFSFLLLSAFLSQQHRQTLDLAKGHVQYPLSQCSSEGFSPLDLRYSINPITREEYFYAFRVRRESNPGSLRRRHHFEALSEAKDMYSTHSNRIPQNRTIPEAPILPMILISKIDG